MAHAWLRPAGRADDSQDDPDSPTPPGTVLLDPLAYIDGERNATTAAAARSNGGPIQVTFWIARPPRVSHLAVHCAGLAPDAFPELPLVVATDDDLALIRISVSRPQGRGHGRSDEFFVYRAGAGTGGRPPLLLMIPEPQQLYGDRKVGILSCRADDKFFIATLVSDPFTRHDRHTTRCIHLFDSETLAWSSRLVHVDWPTNKKYQYAVTNKVITIGGRHGSIGWVDLWHGILVYDVLRGCNNDVLRFIPLPSPPESDLQLQSMVYRSDLKAKGPTVRRPRHHWWRRRHQVLRHVQPRRPHHRRLRRLASGHLEDEGPMGEVAARPPPESFQDHGGPHDTFQPAA
ncbi:uncharacterized protein [Aegilops tauschii subsp. strangulata]|uniref:uncharacterized protein n=1 Tax=Aegilops tauschii subsp. strangulata TaxID=200361 RepID=UPI00098BABD6|nr:uncharacterized protein LOC109740704 [Aegilops tauschii subsp. strangulata]